MDGQQQIEECLSQGVPEVLSLDHGINASLQPEIYCGRGPMPLMFRCEDISYLTILLMDQWGKPTALSWYRF